MTNRDQLARDIAGFLLQINAIKLNVENPFTWASGLRSPIYCDNRRTLSFPRVRQAIVDGFVHLVKTNYPHADMVAGVATGAIAHGVLTASALDLPFVYVRSSPKGHGMGNQVEGHVEKDQQVVVIEDLVSTGKSSLAAIEALRGAGMRVLGMFSIFSYNLDLAQDKFKAANCPVTSLSNYDVLLTLALDEGIISGEQLHELRKWRQDPVSWSAAH